MSNTTNIYPKEGEPWGNRRYTVEEYLDIDDASEEPLEFWDGQIVNMSGGSINHSLISANALVALGGRLRGTPCRVFDASLRVALNRQSLYGHPDVTVVCGDLVTDPKERQGETLLNPRLAVEVLSPSTEQVDRIKKFGRYQMIESFREYVLISQFEPQVEVYRRTDQGWFIVPAVRGLEAVAHLSSITVDLPLAEIYAGVVFPPPDSEIADPPKS